MADILVTCFSRTGSTARVARALARRLGADIDVIRPTESYAGRPGYLRALWRTLSGTRSALRTGKDPANYDLVIVGSPVWAGRLSAPVRDYLRANRDRFTHLAAFWVSGSGAAYESLAGEITQEAGLAPVSMLSLGERHVRAEQLDPPLQTFVDRVQVRTAEAA